MKNIRKFLSGSAKSLLILTLTVAMLFGMNVPQVQATEYNTSTAEANKESIFNYLTQTAGYNCAIACGIMASIQNESGFLPNNVGDAYESSHGYTDASYTAAVDNGTISRDSFMNSGTGYGLCQWTYYTVKGELYDLAKKRGTSIGDLTTQLVFLTSTLKSYNLEQYLTGCANTAEGAYKAGYNFCYYYEVPYNKASTSSSRGSLAQNTYWPVYSKKTTTTSATTTSAAATGTAETTTTTVPTVDTAETTSGPAASATDTSSADTVSADTSYTTGSWTLNDTMTVRSSADTSSAAIGYLSSGTIINVTAVNGRFGQISYNGQTAWVSLKYATQNNNAASSEYATGSWTLSTDMTVRSSADTSSSPVGYLKEGTTVNVTAVDGRFGQISYNGQTAWISLKYATKTGEAAASSAPASGSWRLDSVMTIRSEADTSSSSLGTIGEGATILVTEINGDFGKFEYKGQTAWVSLKYATRIG